MERFWVIFPYFIFGVLSVSMLNSNSVLELRGEEPRRAIISIEMIENDNLIKPTLQGSDYFNKPPLFNWVQIATFKAVNSFDEWAVRLPGVLSLLLTALLIGAFCYRLVSPELGVLSGLAIITTGDLLFYGSIQSGEIDLFYTLVVVLQLMAIYLFHQRKQWLALFAISYTFMTIGFLTKGVPSIAFQGITLLIVLLPQAWRKLYSWQHIISLLVSIILIATYFYIYSLQGDALFYIVNTIKQASQRSAAEFSFTEIILAIIQNPIYLISKGAPWSFGILLLFIPKLRQLIFANSLLKFILIAVAFNILIYLSAPHFRTRYFYVFMVLLSALGSVVFYYFLQFNVKTLPWIRRIYFVILGLLALSLTVVFVKPNIFQIPHLQFSNYSFTLILIALCCLAIYKANNSYRILLTTVFIIGIARVIFNYTALPLQQQALTFRNINTKLITLTNQQPVYTFGMMNLTADIKIFDLNLFEKSQSIPLDYQYPLFYNYYLSTGQVVTNHQGRKPNHFYLDYQQEATHNSILVHENIFRSEDLVLVKPEN